MKCSRKLLAVLLTLVMALSCNFSTPVKNVKAAEQNETKDFWTDPGNYTEGWYAGTTGLDIYGHAGTQEDPYEVKSAKDLAGLSYYSNLVAGDSGATDFSGKYITITAKNIDLSAHYWRPIGTVQKFKGAVNGNNTIIENMYIGSESEYETCGHVGLFGTIYADVKDIAVKNAVIYANSGYTAGFVGEHAGGNIENCSVEGQIYEIRSSGSVGGFAGSQVTGCGSIEKSYACVNIEAGTCKGISVGGFIGHTNSCIVNNCFSKGNIYTGLASESGGFIGYCSSGQQKQCFSIENVKVDSGNAGGFIGKVREDDIYNSYALGNVEAAGTASIGGFIGTGWNYCDMVYVNIENCYAGGGVKSGTNSTETNSIGTSTVTGFFANRDADGLVVNCKNCYWNKSADQFVDGTARSIDAKIGVGHQELSTVVGDDESYMKSQSFVDELNEYVNQSSDTYDKWEIDEITNNGFPYLSVNKASLLTLNGGSKAIELGKEEARNDMKVYGTVIYPEPEETQSPSPSATPGKPDDPEVPTINVDLQWGSLVYVYTAGKYEKETETYADGAWSPKEEGVSDKISITNHSETDIQADYTFLASTEGTGNFANLTGEFYQKDPDTIVSNSVIVKGKEGDSEATQDTFLKIKGVPVEQKTVLTPEVIGNVVVTVSRCTEDKGTE